MTVMVSKPARHYGQGAVAARKGISDAVKEEMRRLLSDGLTREEIAERLGVGRSTVYKALPVTRAPEVPEEALDLIMEAVAAGRETITQVEGLLEEATHSMAQTANVMRQVGMALGRNDERWSRLAELVERLRGLND